ncbi:hypothetical protein CVT26_010406 [Gymnopilus dilepis]|uniref:Uncharacterized protein n=1 Tax=Gymnopilus dilepis TaxID=231916 RepID=A0A409VZ56_9AGAR|nr:hypothetical protein CVT26_010406 [Gymnopilus dilepis]
MDECRLCSSTATNSVELKVAVILWPITPGYWHVEWKNEGEMVILPLDEHAKYVKKLSKEGLASSAIDKNTVIAWIMMKIWVGTHDISQNCPGNYGFIANMQCLEWSELSKAKEYYVHSNKAR